MSHDTNYQLDMFTDPPKHFPAIVNLVSDEWTVYCPTCSDAAGGMVQRCRELDDWPEQTLVPLHYKKKRMGGVALSRRHTDTQKHAALRLAPKAGTLQEKVLDTIRSRRDGMTDEEIEQALSLKHQTASAARNSLMNKGLVADSGFRRNNLNGNPAIVWVGTADG